jgi:hypothetical protein
MSHYLRIEIETLFFCLNFAAFSSGPVFTYFIYDSYFEETPPVACYLHVTAYVGFCRRVLEPFGTAYVCFCRQVLEPIGTAFYLTDNTEFSIGWRIAPS